MELRVQLNWDLEYFFLKRERQQVSSKYNDILQKLKSTPPEQKEKIDALVKQHAYTKDQADELWTSMCDFTKNKNAYKEHYTKQIHKVLNKN